MHASSPRDSQNGDISSAGGGAALKGANLAFQRTLASKPKPRPPVTPAARPNGALVAATSVTRDPSAATRPGRTAGEIRDIRRADHDLASSSPAQQLLTPTRPVVDPKSPSFIAATLAASRSASPSPATPSSNGPSSSRARRRGSFGDQSTASSTMGTPDHPVADPIRPTTSLISMFEDKGKSGDPVKKHTSANRQSSPLKPVSPAPKLGGAPVSLATSPRRASPIPASKLRANRPPAAGEEETTRPTGSPSQREPGSKASYTRVEATSRTGQPSAERSGEARVKADDVPSGNTEIKAPRPQRSISQAALAIGVPNIDAKESYTEEQLPPSKSEPLNSTFVSASSTASPMREQFSQKETRSQASPSPRPPSRRTVTGQRPSPSRPATPAHTQSDTPRTPIYTNPRVSATTLSLPSLTDAMLASSLASVRAAQLPPPVSGPAPSPPPPRRRHRHSISSSIHRVKQHHSGPRGSKGLMYHHTGNSTASLPLPPSPAQRNMPRTLRADRTGEQEKDEAKRMKKKAKGSKRHAHSEGARKRWRDEITTEERRRYEGLWASNKGLLVECLWPPIGPDDGFSGTTASAAAATAAGHDHPRDCVVNIVVRDLWRRSKLPDDELTEVWDLVDRSGRGMLGRHEFVVGLWLVDQRLKGRKIPTRIQESVWMSARGVSIGKK